MHPSRVHGFGSQKGNRTRIVTDAWWDNLKNTPWNSMGRFAMVGHDKLLSSLVCVTPSTGTNKFDFDST
jgi:hypothetical protein